MKTKAVSGIVLTLFLASALTIMFVAASEQTTKNDFIDSFPQPGKFYTLASRLVNWEIVAGEKTTHANDFIEKWSVQDVDGGVAILNYSLAYAPIFPEGVVIMTDIDYEIATNRTILWGYEKTMCFTAAGFQWTDEWPLDMDIGEHTYAWYPTDLHIGALVSEGWTRDDKVPDDVLSEVVGEEVIQILGEKQDCWILRLLPLNGIDGWVHTYSNWVDKDTGIPLKAYVEHWALDGSSGWDMDCVLVNTNIDLGPESALEASPIYIPLTVPTSPGFPEAGKFYTWYRLDEGWYMSGATNVTYYNEGLWTWFVAEVTDDVAVVNMIMWSERVCEAEGVGELEEVTIRYFSYRISITTRGILDITGSGYGINMTSLSWWGWEIPSLANDIGERTYCWLPTNLYIGANVGITWTTDETLDNATYTVTDEKIIGALGETQACWLLYLPPTTTVDGESRVTETFYSDKDVGIALQYISKSEAVDASSAYVGTMRLMDTNINLGPEVTLSIKLTGELDYLYRERVKIRLAALVVDPNTMEPVPGADVTVDIYDPDGNLWLSAEMVERLPGTGIYEWESSDTIKALKLEKGIYLVHARTSFPSGPTAYDILEFHIDPPTDSGALTTLIVCGAVVLVAVAALLSQRKIINHRLCRTSQRSNVHTG